MYGVSTDGNARPHRAIIEGLTIMFEAIEPKRGILRRPAIKGVKVSRDGKGRIVLAFGNDLCERIGFAAGDRINILWGSGDDAGLMRVELNPNGHHKLYARKDKSNTLRTYTTMQPAWMQKTTVPSTSALILQEAIRSVTFDLPVAMFYNKPISVVA